MGDILQSGDGTYVEFSASTPEADTWMRAQVGDITVRFSFPDEVESMKQFKASAESAGLVLYTP